MMKGVIMSATEINAAAPAAFQGSGRLILGIIAGVLTFWLFAQSVVNIVPAIQQEVAIPLESLNLAISLTGLFPAVLLWWRAASAIVLAG